MTTKKVFSSGILILLLIACIVFSMVLFGCAPGQISGSTQNTNISVENVVPPSVSDWVLPIIVSITGSDSAMGLAAAWGFDYGVKTVNEQGGIRGVPVSITIRDAASSDTKTSTEVGLAAADALIVLGPPTESLYKAGGRAFYDAGLPAVGAATDSKNRKAYQPFAISCISDPDSLAGSAANGWMNAEKFSSVYIISSPASQERTSFIEVALISGGKKIVEKISLGNEEYDTVSVAEKALQSGAEAFYIDLDFDDALLIIRQMKTMTDSDADKLIILTGPGTADIGLLETDEEGVLHGASVWTAYDFSKDIEKRKAFNDAFELSIGDPALYSIAVDYYQAALMLKQAIDELGLTGAESELIHERELLANYLFNSGLITTIHGDFTIVSGSKNIVAKLYKITEKGLQ